MKIPCVSCQSLFRLDSKLVKAAGSLTRCSKCNYIFMVYPPNYDDDPIVKDTNIDQSILDDLFKVEQTNVAKGILGQFSEEISIHGVDEIASMGDFEQEEEPDPEIEDVEYADLPDLSEYEDMIDWDESSDHGDPAKI